MHVACAGGELVSLPAAGGDAVRTVTLARDLRDVVVDGPRLRVSRFLTAEVLTVEADGTVSGTVATPAFRATSARGGQRYTPSIAWKMSEMPDGSGVMMLHQRGVDEEVQPVVGGYGGPDACNGIVHPAVTMVVVRRQHAQRTGDGRHGAGGRHGDLARRAGASPSSRPATPPTRFRATAQPDLTRVFVSDTDSVTDDHVGCMPDGMHGPCSAGFVGGTAARDG